MKPLVLSLVCGIIGFARDADDPKGRHVGDQLIRRSVPGRIKNQSVVGARALGYSERRDALRRHANACFAGFHGCGQRGHCQPEVVILQLKEQARASAGPDMFGASRCQHALGAE